MDKLKLLNPQEVMKKLDISYSTLLRMVKSGTLPSVKVGSQIRIPETYFLLLETEAYDSYIKKTEEPVESL